MDLRPGKQIIPYPVDLRDLRTPPEMVKYYWQKDFANAVHFSRSESKTLNGWTGWGCGIYSLVYVLKDFGYKFNFKTILEITEMMYRPKINGLRPEEIIKVVDEIRERGIAKVRASVVFVRGEEEISSLLKDKNKRVIVNYWDDIFGWVPPMENDPDAPLKWDWGHYSPVIAIKDGRVIIASSSYRYYRYGYGIAGIPIEQFKKIHCDYIPEENAVSSGGIAREGLTWYRGLVLVVENLKPRN